MKTGVGGVADPDLALVGRQANAVAGAAVPLHLALLEPLYLDAMQFFAAGEVADLEAEQAVDVDEAERPRRVDRERPDRGAERPDRPQHFLRVAVYDGKQRRAQAGEVSLGAVEADDRVVRAALRLDLRDDIASRPLDDVPVRPLQRRHVEVLAVGRDRHAIAASGQRLLPQRLLADEVEAIELFEGREVELA